VLDPGSVLGVVTVRFTLADPEGDSADILAEYSIDGGASFHGAAEAVGGSSEGSWDLFTTSSGHAHEFHWNSYPDLGGGDQTAIFRITPTDRTTGLTGPAADSVSFTVANSLVNTVAGRSTPALGAVTGAAADPATSVLYFTERYGHRLMALNGSAAPALVLGRTLNPGQLAIVAGTGEGGYNGDHRPASSAMLNDPGGVALDLSSPPNIYIADRSNHRVRKVDGSTGYITTVTGDGTSGTADARPANQGRLDYPEEVCASALSATCSSPTRATTSSAR
jgi:hypothetical protein